MPQTDELATFLVNFLVLLGIVKLFEPERDDIGIFDLVIVAVVPAFLALAIAVALGLFIGPVLLQLVTPTLLIALVTYALLRRFLKIPAKRAVWYAIGVVAVNSVFAYTQANSF